MMKKRQVHGIWHVINLDSSYSIAFPTQYIIWTSFDVSDYEKRNDIDVSDMILSFGLRVRSR
jgi:hypothetical protein